MSLVAYDGPRTLEEMRAAHKARQARMRAGAVEVAPLRVSYSDRSALGAERIARQVEEVRKREREAEEKLANEKAARRAADEEMRRLGILSLAPSILAVVAEDFGVTVPHMLSRRRTKKIVRARWVAMWLMRELTPQSYPEIGRRLGGLDHTTVIHGVRKLERDLVLRAIAERLSKIIKP